VSSGKNGSDDWNGFNDRREWAADGRKMLKVNSEERETGASLWVVIERGKSDRKGTGRGRHEDGKKKLISKP